MFSLPDPVSWQTRRSGKTVANTGGVDPNYSGDEQSFLNGKEKIDMNNALIRGAKISENPMRGKRMVL